MKKTCKKCGFEGDENLFVRRELVCIECKKQYQKNWRDNNKDYTRNYNRENADRLNKLKREHYKNNKDYYSEKNKKWYRENKQEKIEYNKRWVKNNPEKITEQRNRRKPKLKDYRENNKEKAKKYYNEYKQTRNKKRKDRLINDIGYRVSTSIRSRFARAMRLYSKTGKIYNIRDYSINIDKIISYIGDPPNDGRKYHIDHKLPVSAFDHNNLNEIKMCWHPMNLRWLEESENIRKSFNYDEHELVKYKNEFVKLSDEFDRVLQDHSVKTSRIKVRQIESK